MHDAEAGVIEAAAELVSWCRSRPTTLVLLFFFVVPMLVVIAVSFFDYETHEIVETFILDNYQRRLHLERNAAALSQVAEVRRHRLG